MVPINRALDWFCSRHTHSLSRSPACPPHDIVAISVNIKVLRQGKCRR